MKAVVCFFNNGVFDMALDEIISDQISAMVLTGAKANGDLTAMADRNATQGLTVVNTSLIQQTGGVADDAGLIAALQTASRTPQQGQTPAA